MSKLLAAVAAALLVTAAIAVGPLTHLAWTRDHHAPGATLADGSLNPGARQPAAGSGELGSGEPGSGDPGSGDPGSGDPGFGETGSRVGSTDTPTDTSTGSSGGPSTAPATPGHRRVVRTTPLRGTPATHPSTHPATPAGPTSGSGVTAGVARSVNLTLPGTVRVGSNVLGYIRVADSNGQVTSPVPGVLVTLQQRRAGTWVSISDNVTDDNGLVALSFTSRTSMTLRAAVIENGRPVLSPVRVMAANDLVTWAARPTLSVRHSVATTFQYRIRPATGSARLEFARAGDPTHWIAAPTTTVGIAGVVGQDISFPSAGVWLASSRYRASAASTE